MNGFLVKLDFLPRSCGRSLADFKFLMEKHACEMRVRLDWMKCFLLTSTGDDYEHFVIISTSDSCFFLVGFVRDDS
jgi:hypothetical protein